MNSGARKVNTKPMPQSTSTRNDPAHDVLRSARHPLDAFFHPRTVAVIGATENPSSVGRTVLQNLVQSPFGGTVFPVNPKRPSILGIKAYPSIADVPDKVELAVIVTPAGSVPGLIQQCTAVGVKAAIVISAGFKEVGESGVELERQILEESRRGNMRIIGPNCLGVMSPVSGVNATFAATIARTGNVAFLSQSGALCTAVLDWSLREMVGFSAFISVGSMLDVGWGDLIDYFGNDPNTESIVIYMESIGDARAFLSAAREVALTKPIIVIKAGRTEQGGKAAASHTGALTGSDEVLDTAFRRSGVLRVANISDLFYTAEVLAKQPRPQGPRLAILTNAGGPGVLATDALIASGGKLADLQPETVLALNEVLPAAWSHGNPVDVLGDASPDRYAKALQITARDPGIDGMLVVLTPQAMTDPTQTAEQLRPYAAIEGKPVLGSWMGGTSVAAGQSILNAAGIPAFPYPDTATKIFSYMWQYASNLKELYETPSLPEDFGEEGSGRGEVADILGEARKSGRTILTEVESKQVLAAYGIPTVPTEVAVTEEDAVKASERMGYPIVLKLYSLTITHKTDVGGVQLNLIDADAVRTAFRTIYNSVKKNAGIEHFQGVAVQPMVKVSGYELILGSSPDPQFGPVLLFGTGGQLVEVFKDRSLALPPLNTTLARRMMETTKIYTALKGVRGRKAVDLEALEHLMVAFSRLVVEQPWIKEIDINPLLASEDQLIALDARVVLHDASVPAEKLPRLAIRPYPTQYVCPWTMSDGTTVTLRPIRPEDEPLLVKFHGDLSERSVYLRYFQPFQLEQRTAHERLTRICFNDYDREIALVAEGKDEAGGPAILAVGRLSKVPGLHEGRISTLVSDNYQGRGMGTELVRQLIQVAREEKLERISAVIVKDNIDMQNICGHLRFSISDPGPDGMVKAQLEL